MEERVAIIAIVVEDRNQVEEMNKVLTEFGSYIVGRMGIPYEKRGVNLISVAIDAPQDVISTISGRLGNIKGITAKAVYSKI